MEFLDESTLMFLASGIIADSLCSGVLLSSILGAAKADIGHFFGLIVDVIFMLVFLLDLLIVPFIEVIVHDLIQHLILLRLVLTHHQDFLIHFSLLPFGHFGTVFLLKSISHHPLALALKAFEPFSNVFLLQSISHFLDLFIM